MILTLQKPSHCVWIHSLKTTPCLKGILLKQIRLNLKKVYLRYVRFVTFKQIFLGMIPLILIYALGGQLVAPQIASAQDQQQDSHFIGDINELYIAAKLLRTLRSRTTDFDKTQKMFAQVYLRGVSVTQKLKDFDEKGRLKNKKELLQRLRSIAEIAGVDFYKTSSHGKVIPNTKSPEDAARDFFKKYNPPLYEFILSKSSQNSHWGSTLHPFSSLPNKPPWKTKLRQSGQMFANQLFAFSLAQMTISVAPPIFGGNPVSVEQSWGAVTDPYGIIAFGGFVGAHWGTNKTLSRWPVLPSSLNNFIGMAVGFSISAALHELFIDTDLRSCWFAGDEAACEIAGKRWLTKDKYVGNTPDILAMGVSAGVSHLIFSQTMEKALKAMPPSMALKVSQAMRLPLFTFSPISLVLNTASFVLFLGLHQAIAPTFYDVWDPLNLNWLGWSLSEELKKEKPYVSEYIRSYQQSKKEMEWLRNHTGALLHHRDSYAECLTQSIFRVNAIPQSSHLENEPSQQLQHKYFLKKQQKCERRLQPAFIVQTNAAFERASDTLRLKNFRNQQMNWFMLVSNYAEVYGVSRMVYKLFHDLKKEELKLKAQRDQHQYDQSQYEEKIKALRTKREDLFSSQKNFRTYVDQLRPHRKSKDGSPEYDSSEIPFPKSVGNTKLGHLADYILYSMACGSNILKTQNPFTQSEDSFENTADVEMIKTPFGSSFEFIPPKITDTNRFVCTRHSLGFNSLLPTQNSQNLEDISKDIKERNDVYRGRWLGSDQKKYNSLPDYIFENMDPSFVNKDFNHGKDSSHDHDSFPWWSTHVDKPTGKVWKAYNKAYIKLVTKELIPELVGEPHKTQRVRRPVHPRSFQRQDPSPDKAHNYNRRQPRWADQNRHQRNSRPSNELGLIDQTYQRLQADQQLVLDLADKAGISKEKLKSDFALALALMQEEMSFHKSFLKDWNNEYSLYSSPEEVLSLVTQMMNSLDSITMEIAKMGVIEEPYTKQQLLELRDRQHYLVIMLSVVEIMQQRVVSYFQTVAGLTTTLGFKGSE